MLNGIKVYYVNVGQIMAVVATTVLVAAYMLDDKLKRGKCEER